jgi:hypothetical protein
MHVHTAPPVAPTLAAAPATSSVKPDPLAPPPSIANTPAAAFTAHHLLRLPSAASPRSLCHRCRRPNPLPPRLHRHAHKPRRPRQAPRQPPRSPTAATSSGQVASWAQMAASRLSSAATTAAEASSTPRRCSATLPHSAGMIYL